MYNSNEDSSAFPFAIVISALILFFASFFITWKTHTYHCVYDNQVYSSGGSVQSKGTVIRFTVDEKNKSFVAEDNSRRFAILSPAGERNFFKLVKAPYKVIVYKNFWGIITRDFSAE